MKIIQKAGGGQAESTHLSILQGMQFKEQRLFCKLGSDSESASSGFVSILLTMSDSQGQNNGEKYAELGDFSLALRLLRNNKGCLRNVCISERS